MIQEVSRRPPSEAAIAGVAVASTVWSTAAMNIGRNTAAKRFRNSARETVSARFSALTPWFLIEVCLHETPPRDTHAAEHASQSAAPRRNRFSEEPQLLAGRDHRGRQGRLARGTNHGDRPRRPGHRRE